MLIRSRRLYTYVRGAEATGISFFPTRTPASSARISTNKQLADTVDRYGAGTRAGAADQHRPSPRRGFGEAFEEEEEAATTLPLFHDGSSISTKNKKPALVGWPPVSSARSRACSGGGGNGRHVKVRKEGAAIGRKLDLSLHGCYGELLATLARMFPATAGGDQAAGCLGSTAEKDAGLVVTYEDADGDWMLLGDVPWDNFARSVKRLKILL